MDISVTRDHWGRARIVIEDEADAEQLYHLYVNAGGDDYKAQVDQLEGKLYDYKAQVDQLEGKLGDANDKIDELVGELGDANDKITMLEEKYT